MPMTIHEHAYRPAVAIPLLLTVLLAQSMTSAQAPRDPTVATSETEVREESWNQLRSVAVGTRVGLTLQDGAEIEGELVELRTDAVVVQHTRVIKGGTHGRCHNPTRAGADVSRPDVVSVRAPAWVRSAANRIGDFLYDVVDVGFGETLALAGIGLVGLAQAVRGRLAK